MLWIGLTGAMGSGKSTVAKVLREKGFPVLDADQIVHDLLLPGSEAEREILSTFGQSVAGTDGKLDRRALGRIVFADDKKLAQLEAILHPKVRADVAALRSALELTGNRAAFYDVPLLFEKNMEGDFDHVLVVSAREDLRRQRVHTRMGLSDAEFDAREKTFVKPEIKERRASAVIDNNGDAMNLVQEVMRALEKLGLKSPAVGNP